jgi:hypothetical protein
MSSKLPRYSSDIIEKITDAEWHATKKNDKLWIIMPDALNGYLIASGSALTRDLGIKVPHKLHWVSLQHTDGANALNTASLDWSWSILGILGKHQFPNAHPLIDYSSSTASRFFEDMDKLKLPHTVYRFGYNTTNTHRLFLAICIEVL